MANELATDFLVNKNTYFLVRNSTGGIWNGAAFEAYQTANYANYPITATEQGTASGYYTASFPVTSAGVYYTVAKQRAGVSPVETDITIGTGILQWSGTAVLSLNSSSTNVLTADITPLQSSASVHSLLSAVLKLISRFDVKDSTNGNNSTVYRLDGVTVHMTQTPTTSSALVPIKALGVGA